MDEDIIRKAQQSNLGFVLNLIPTEDVWVFQFLYDLVMVVNITVGSFFFFAVSLLLLVQTKNFLAAQPTSIRMSTKKVT